LLREEAVMAADGATSGAAAGMAVDTSWTGIWTGSFGARTDLALIVTEDGGFEVLLLGHPVRLTQAAFKPDACVLSGPDITLTLQRVDSSVAQGSYVNAAGRKATALFRRA
jgi:hypothetical protein